MMKLQPLELQAQGSSEKKRANSQQNKSEEAKSNRSKEKGQHDLNSTNDKKPELD